MLISEIFRVLKDRAGVSDETFLLKEVNRAMQELWYQLDTPEALLEYDFRLDAENKAVLPWFVYQEKAIKLASALVVKLEHARPYYNTDDWQHSPFEIRTLHRTPLLTMLTAPGRLTLRPKKPLTAPVTITVKGPGEMGAVEWEDIELGAGAKQVETQGVYYDLTTLSKSALTAADIIVYNPQNTIVAVLPAHLDSVWNKLIQVFDRRCNAIVTVNNVYTCLYKAHPPVFTRATDAVPDEYGLVLQRILLSDIIGKGRDEESQNLADKHGMKAAAYSGKLVRRENEGKSNRVNMATNPYTYAHHGYL